jgi:hypothetical protein
VIIIFISSGGGRTLGVTWNVFFAKSFTGRSWGDYENESPVRTKKKNREKLKRKKNENETKNE